jgi:hypothetical protein
MYMKIGIINVLLFISLTGVSFAQLLLNEIMASNASTVADDDGQFEDWVELYNAGSDTLKLSGFALSNTESQPMRWIFPDTLIYPGEYIVVWASGKDRAVGGNELHLSFSISATGEDVILTAPDGITIDHVLPIPLRTGISYGRLPDGAGSWFYFSEPTPGQSNSGPGFQGIAPSPLLSCPSGFYTDDIVVTLEVGEEGITIYYTLDGTEPTDSSAVYSGPIVITDRSDEPNVLSLIPNNVDFNWQPPGKLIKKGTVIRAKAIRENFLPSQTVTRSYFIDELGRDLYSLPVISLVTDPAHLFDFENGIYVPGIHSVPSPETPWHQEGNFTMRGREWERMVHIELIDTDGTVAFAMPAGVRIHGGSTRSLPQKSLRLYARSEYGESWFIYKLFPDKSIDRFKRLILRNSGNDWESTMFRDAFLQRLLGGFDIDRQGYRPSIVFINGEYWGIHNIRDRIDAYYIETHHNVPADEIDLLSNNGEIIEGDRDHFLQLIDFIEINDLSDSVNLDFVNSVVDIENLMTYFAFNIYIGNTDWPGNNLSYWRPRTPDGRWRWIVFDTDFGFSLFNGEDGYRLNTLSLNLSPDNSPWPHPLRILSLFQKLMENSQARYRFINRLADFMNTIFLPEYVISVIDDMEQSIESEMPEHFQRWIPTKPVSAWQASVNQLRAYALLRPEYVRMHIVEQFELPGVAEITVDIDSPNAGFIQVNSIFIEQGQAGVADPDQPYPWHGRYFQSVPVQLIAHPQAGYSFTGWNNGLSDSDTLVVFLVGDTTFTAHFLPAVDFPGDDMNPPAYDLSAGPYLFEYWYENELEGRFPPYMIFQQSNLSDPVLTDEMTHPYHIPYIDENNNEYHADDQDKIGYPYKLTGRTRINGLGIDGISLINTGRGRDLGAVVLAINTLDCEDLYVSFVAGTIFPNNRIYGLRLQYRAGVREEFRDITDMNGVPIEYVSNKVGGHSQLFEPIRLPEILQNKPYVQLRWKYYHVSGTSGPRAMLRLDDISVTVGIPDDPMNPTSHILLDGVYEFSYWDENEPEGSYPQNMVFLQSSMTDPGLFDEMTAPYRIPFFDEDNNDYHANDQDKIGYPYKLTGRTRINGLGHEGISFINTGQGSDLGAAVLAIDATGMSNIQVSWIGGTVIPNSRVYNIRLQYRVGTDDPFSDLLYDGVPVEYRRNEVPDHFEYIGPVVLPEVVDDQPYVQLRWKYYFTGERLDPDVGRRDMLRLDDIQVTGTPVGVDKSVELPSTYQLFQNYPNPFNPSTVISFALPEDSRVRIELYNTLGQKLEVIINREIEAGFHSVEWKPSVSWMASGVYFYTFIARPVRNPADRFYQVKSMMYIR